MSVNRWIWVGLLLTYAVFFGWYTSFDGPLTDDEIDHYLERLDAQADNADPEMRALLKRFMEEDTGDDFVMINLIDLYETPLAMAGVPPHESSSEMLDRYMAFMYPELLSRASHPVLFGNAASVAMDLMNAHGMESWTAAAAMRYRSRRDLVEIATKPAFRGSHVYKTAAMHKTIAFPLDPWFHPGDPRLILALVFALIGCTVSWRLAARAGRSG